MEKEGKGDEPKGNQGEEERKERKKERRGTKTKYEGNNSRTISDRF